MSGPVPPFAAESPAGRTLIALRAGAMSSAELYERFAGNHALAELHKRGFVEQCIAGGWKLTAAGREACPLRNPLAGGLPPDPPRAITARKAPLSVLSSRHSSTPKPTAQGDSAMPLYVNEDLSPINQVRQRLVGSPEGITRRQLMRDLKHLSEARIDNAIFKLCEAGEAARPKMGFLVATDRLKSVAVVPLAPAPREEARKPETETPAAPVKELAKPAPAAPTVPEIEFSIYDDGRLAIIDGDEILVLPPDATRRLGRFLGYFEALAA